MYCEDYARADSHVAGSRSQRHTHIPSDRLVRCRTRGGEFASPLLGLAEFYTFGALVVSTALVQVALWAASTKTNARAKWLMHATVLHIPLLLALMVYDKIPR